VPVLEDWALGRLASGRRNLLIMMPVRHSKSRLGSQLLPAYSLGRRSRTAPAPEQVIQACYDQGHASEQNDYVQTIIRTPEYRAVFPGLELNPARSNLRTFQLLLQTKKAAIYHCVGLDSGVAGKGAHRLHIDDPVKGRETAESPTMRERIWRWLKDDLLTRQMPDMGTLMIATRWHPDDPPGRLLAEMRDSPRALQWDVVCLPAVLDGEALEDPVYRLSQKGPMPDWR